MPIMPFTKSKRPLKIAVIIKRFITTGGAERYAYEITKRIAKEHEVHVFAHKWDYDASDIKFHRLANPINKPSWIKQWVFSRKCGDILKKDNFDIVHTHEKIVNFDVMTIHSPCFKSGVFKSKKNALGIIKLLTTFFNPRKLGWLLLENRQFKSGKNKIFIAVSNNVKEDVMLSYGTEDSRFHIAYPGVGLNMELLNVCKQEKVNLRKSYGISSEDTVFLFVGSEFKRKGLDVLLRAIAGLKDEKVKLLVAGDGGGRLREYEALVGKMGISQKVTFLGLVKEVERLYGISDALVLPTISDPSPLVPLEAMWCGVPVVMSAPKYCGASEHIRNDEALILKDPHDSATLSQLLRRLLDPHFRREMSLKGRELAMGITWDKTTQETLLAYEHALRFKAYPRET